MSLSRGGKPILGGGGGGISDGDKGDITVSGSGSVFTIDNDAVTLAKMQNLAASRVLGRGDSGSGDPEELSLLGFLAFQGASVYSGPWKRWFHIQANTGATSRSSIPQNVAQTPAGTLSSVPDADGPWIQSATSASVGNAADFSDSGVYRRDWGAWGRWRIRTGASVADVRIKCGFVSGASGNSDYGGSLHQAELVYSTPGSFGGWRALTNDATSGTGAASGDLAAIAADTVYEVDVQMRADRVRFGLNGVWLYESTTKLPSATTLLFGRCQITTQAAAVKEIKYARSTYLFEV